MGKMELPVERFGAFDLGWYFVYIIANKIYFLFSTDFCLEALSAAFNT